LEQLLKDLTEEKWQFSGWCVDSLSKQNRCALTDSREPWTILNVRKTNSNDCDYKYWIWRPPSDIPRCRILEGKPCTRQDCPQKLKKEWQG